MRLTELAPRWLMHEGNPHAALAFKCPHCRDTWLTCTLVEMTFKQQCAAIIAGGLNEKMEAADVVTCETLAWSATNVPNFEQLTITPSLDASKSGHWHGHITAGAIVG